jgi:hypothetical protein
MNTESGRDFLRVYDGEGDDKRMLGEFSGSYVPSNPFLPVTAVRGSATIEFTSDAFNNADGWEIVYRVQPFCFGNVVLSNNTGVIDDGSGPARNYETSSDCSWLIQVPGAVFTTLTFESFALERNFDFLKVYDGVSTQSPLLASLDGINIPGPITGNSGRMLLKLTTDSSLNMAGFRLRYRSDGYTDPPTFSQVRLMESFSCKGLLILEGISGRFGSQGDSRTWYEPNRDCSWRIRGPQGENQIILVNFTTLDVENNFDYIDVFDGADANGVHLGRLTGGTPPRAPYRASSGAMYFLVTAINSQRLL